MPSACEPVGAAGKQAGRHVDMIVLALTREDELVLSCSWL